MSVRDWNDPQQFETTLPRELLGCFLCPRPAATSVFLAGGRPISRADAGLPPQCGGSPLFSVSEVLPPTMRL